MAIQRHVTRTEGAETPTITKRLRTQFPIDESRKYSSDRHMRPPLPLPWPEYKPGPHIHVGYSEVIINGPLLLVIVDHEGDRRMPG